MNIGDKLYCKAAVSVAYSVEDLQRNVKKVISSLDVDTLNGTYGFDDAKEPFTIRVNRPKSVGFLKSIIEVDGQSYGLVDLPCVHYDDGHDGFFGAFSSPSVQRQFTINLGFNLNDLTSTKPDDFKEKVDDVSENATPNKKAPKPPVTGASGKDTPEKKNNNLLFGGIGLAVLGFCIWFFGFRKS